MIFQLQEFEENNKLAAPRGRLKLASEKGTNIILLVVLPRFFIVLNSYSFCFFISYL